MKNKKASKIYWGIVFIAAAVFIILSCIGVNLGFIGTLPVTDIVLSLIILSITVVAAVNLDLFAIPFGLAVIFMLFESEIATYLGREDPNIISNWLLLGCALLIAIGLSLLVNPIKSKHFRHFRSAWRGKNIKFGSETKYIDCTDFTEYTYSVKMGDGNLFFENIENYKGNGVLNVECRMGDLNIHVPRTWHIVTNIETSMGDVDSDGCGTLEGPLLTIKGICKMGDIDISYC